MLVGEAYGEEEDRTGEPFVGVSGQELNRMLGEAQIMRSELYLTNVINARPPGNDIGRWIAEKKKDWTPAHRELRGRMCLPIVHEGVRQLEEEIRLVNPNVIIAAGNTPLWALTGATGILKWRGSMLQARFVGGELPPKVLPIIHPAAVLRDWRQRAPTVRDLKRVRVASHDRQLVQPDWHFIVRPSFEQVCVCLNTLLEELNSRSEGLWLTFDLETRAGHIACAGIAWSKTEAICVPLMCVEDREGYWLPELELEVVWLLRQVLTHPNARVRGQNLLYDCQYTYRHWHFVPRVAQDTMISQHALFSDMPKALDFQASMYCEHYVYWKQEGKTWSEAATEDQLWKYNAQDCVYTHEAGEVELATVKALGLSQVHADQQRLFWPVLQAMQRGVRVREKGRNKLVAEIQEQLALREALLRFLVGHPINPRSSQQLQRLFYDDLQQAPIFTRAKKDAPSRVTCDDEALQKIGEREPLLQPITSAIADIRTLGKFLNDFILAKVDSDGRMRCSYNIGGSESGTSAPKTYRLSSSTNAFGGGSNLQTIPSDKSKSVGKWEKRAKGVQLAGLGDAYKLPNLRSMFGPDPGMTFFDMDLDRADLQVVVWEAEDEMLKAALRMGADIHLLNAFVIQGKEPPPLEELVESHPRYADHRGPQKYVREFAKVFCHACVDEEHEALTKQGWKKMAELSPEDEILVCSIDGAAAHYERPSGWWSGPARTDLLHFSGQAVDQCVTVDHRMPFTTDTRWRVTTAQELPASARLPKSVVLQGSLDHPHPRLLAAFHADGRPDAHGNVYWHFKKERKVERLEALLQGFEFSRYDETDAVRFYLPHRQASLLQLTDKELTADCLQWTHEAARLYLAEQVYWDGHQGVTGAQWMTSVKARHADLAHTLAHLHGFGSQWDERPAYENKQRLYRWSLNNRTEWALSSASVTRLSGVGKTVYCPTTSTGFWLTRRNGRISVTGNTNYVGSARTVAGHTGRTVHEIDRAQKIWFGAHPGIKRMHQRVEQQILKHRFVENRFGYRWYIFDRVEGVLPEAVSWVPQSTVSNVINRAWLNVHENAKEVEVLLQVHDSLAGQFPTDKRTECLAKLKELSRVVIPYEDPLVIPTGIKTSEVSWGDCA